MVIQSKIAWLLLLLCFVIGCDSAESMLDEFPTDDEPADVMANDEYDDVEADEEPIADIEPSKESDLDSDPYTNIDQFLQAHVDDGPIAGAAITIVSADEVLFVQGYGYRDVEAGLPANTDTLFHIGSVNKSMTALMIATLVEEGLVDWDTPANDVYAGFVLSEQASTEQVTLRHLLSMTSGIPDWIEEDFDVDNLSGDDIMPFLASAELLDAPGEEFSYSNISASAAGYLAVIAATGSEQQLYEGYAEQLTQRVLRPIGMSESRVHVSDLSDNPDYGYSYVVTNGKLVVAEPEDYDDDPLAPSGVVKSSVNEMALYAQTFLNDGVAPNGTRIVSAATIDDLWQPSLENYALGWQIEALNGVTYIQHEGSFDNYLSLVGLFPDDDLGFVVLTNTADSAEPLIESIAQQIVALWISAD